MAGNTCVIPYGDRVTLRIAVSRGTFHLVPLIFSLSYLPARLTVPAVVGHPDLRPTSCIPSPTRLHGYRGRLGKHRMRRIPRI